MQRIVLLASVALACHINVAVSQTSNSASNVDAREVFRQAFEHYKNKNYAEAEKLFSIGIKARSGDAQAHFYLAESLLALGKRSQAKTSFEQALKLGLPDPSKARATRMIGVLSRPPATELAAKNGCLSCHGPVKRAVGPSFGEIRARYINYANAEAVLLQSTLEGSIGKWGNVPMPSNRNIVSSADAAAIIEWILTGDLTVLGTAADTGTKSANTGGSFIYFLQAGVYASSEEAERHRAQLVKLGFTAEVSKREQGGRMVHRVRLGPYEKKEELDASKERLLVHGIDAAVVFVER